MLQLGWYVGPNWDGVKDLQNEDGSLGCWMFDSLGTCANPAMIFSMIGVLSLLGVWPMICEYSALSGRLWSLESRSPAGGGACRLSLAVSVDATAIYLVSPPSEKIWGSDSESTTDFTRYDVNVCLMDDIERWLLSSDCRFRYLQRSSSTRFARILLLVCKVMVKAWPYYEQQSGQGVLILTLLWHMKFV